MFSPFGPFRSADAFFRNAEIWFTTTTDRGSNEVAARHIIQSFIAKHLGLAPVYFANSDCMEHLAHLITLGSMKTVDEELRSRRPWRYFSSLAVFSHTVRGLAKRIYHEWCFQHGPLSAKQLVHKLFPRCDSGRWNSTDDTEKRILACTQSRFEPVLRKVLTQAISSDTCGPASSTVWGDVNADKDDGGQGADAGTAGKAKDKAKAKAKPKPNSAQSKGSSEAANVAASDKGGKRDKGKSDDDFKEVDGLSMQESQAYSRKMGKYRRSSLCCAADPVWWALLQIMNCVKQPAVHLSSFVKKNLDKKTLTVRGNALTQLVHGKAQDLLQECERTLDCVVLHQALDSAQSDRILDGEYVSHSGHVFLRAGVDQSRHPACSLGGLASAVAHLF